MGPEILIAGAGPTGLTLAIELARREVPVRVVDRAPEFFAGSRGDGLQPRTLEVFDDLGVLDAIFAAGAPVPVMRAYAGGRFAGEGRMSDPVEPTPDVPYPNVWTIGQSRTERILRDRLAGLGVRVESGTELTGCTQDSDGVTVSLRRDGNTETARVAYLVGADGGKSTVRRALGIPFEGSTDESIRMLLGDVRVDGLDHDFGHWFASARDMRTGIALTPLPGGDQFQFAAPLGDAEADASVATLRRMLAEFSGRDDLRLREVTWSTVWRPNVRLAARFRDGRVFLAGDAAHVHPPTGGQGLNTGVQDAYNLGWKLASGVGELLDSYQAERLPIAARVLGISTDLLRRHAEGAEDAFRRDESTRQLDLTYRDGPLADDRRPNPGRLRSGDRAPDAPLLDPAGNPVRLFDLFRGPHATHLTFGAGWAEGRLPSTRRSEGVLQPARRGKGVLQPTYRILAEGSAPDGVSFVDSGGYAFSGYDVVEGISVTVRPDGYVGRIG